MLRTCRETRKWDPRRGWVAAMSDAGIDRSCMNRLIAGDMKALEELYDRHTPLLYGLVLRIVGRAADAEEVLQDTWVHAWRRAETWEPGRGTVTAWLVTLARSRALGPVPSVSGPRPGQGAGAPPGPPPPGAAGG